MSNNNNGKCLPFTENQNKFYFSWRPSQRKSEIDEHVRWKLNTKLNFEAERIQRCKTFDSLWNKPTIQFSKNHLQGSSQMHVKWRWAYIKLWPTRRFARMKILSHAVKVFWNKCHLGGAIVCRKSQFLFHFAQSSSRQNLRKLSRAL